MTSQGGLYEYRLPGPVAPPSPPEETLLPQQQKAQNVHATNNPSPYFYSTASAVSAAHPTPATHRSPHTNLNDFASMYPANGSNYSNPVPYESQTTLSSLFSLAYKKALAIASNPSQALPTHNKNPSNDLPSTYNGSSTPSTSSALQIPNAEALRYAGLCALWYASSALSSNTGKSIMARFRYPVTLTLIQFGFVAGYCVLFCLVREKFKELNAGNIASHRNWGKESRRRSSISDLDWTLLNGLSAWGIKKPSKQALHGTLVMSFFQIAGHVFSSMAIARVPVSTVHTIKVRPAIREMLGPHCRRICAHRHSRLYSPFFHTPCCSEFATRQLPTSLWLHLQPVSCSPALSTFEPMRQV